MATHRLYVGTIGEGLWRSTDGGAASCVPVTACSWNAMSGRWRSIRASRRFSISDLEMGLFRSTDGADNWSRVESPLNGRQIWSILLHPHRPDLLLVGTCPARLYRSEDAGATWAEADVAMARSVRASCGIA